MAKIRLVTTDLDGTLLNSEGKLSSENRTALQMAIEAGVIVTISTGRMFSSTLRFANEIGITNPLICYNGALIKEPLSQRVIRHTPLRMDLAREMLAYLKKRKAYVQSYIDDILYVHDKEEFLAKDYERVYGIRGAAIGDLIYEPHIEPTKLLSMASSLEDAHLLSNELRERFGDAIYIARSSAEFVEMMDISVNKGVALKALAESMGIAPDEILALGDGENDVEMLRYAGIGCAVNNACTAAKAAAREEVPSNDENGVAWAVQQFILSDH